MDGAWLRHRSPKDGWLIVVVASLVACSQGESSSRVAPPTVSVPPDATKELRNVVASPMSMPQYLQFTQYANFGSRLVRISDQSAFASHQIFLRHAYAKNQPWNADGSLVMLGYTYPAAIIDGQSFRLLRWIHQPSYAVWSHVDPKKLFGTIAGTGTLVTMDATEDNSYEVVHHFGEYEEISFGAGEGNLSNDDRYIAVFGFGSGRTELLVFDLVLRATVSRLDFGTSRVCDCPDPESINNATMSQSGEYVVVQYNERGHGRFKGIEVFDRQLRFIQQLTLGSEHGDVGVTHEGADVWVAWRDSSGHDTLRGGAAFAWHLADGLAIPVIPFGATMGHISCRNYRRPGYCYASHTIDASGRQVIGNDQLYAFPLDGSMQMEVFVHQRSTATTYDRHAMGVPNPDGTQVLWASDWGDSTGPVLAYVAMKQ